METKYFVFEAVIYRQMSVRLICMVCIKEAHKCEVISFNLLHVSSRELDMAVEMLLSLCFYAYILPCDLLNM